VAAAGAGMKIMRTLAAFASGLALAASAP